MSSGKYSASQAMQLYRSNNNKSPSTGVGVGNYGTTTSEIKDEEQEEKDADEGSIVAEHAEATVTTTMLAPVVSSSVSPGQRRRASITVRMGGGTNGGNISGGSSNSMDSSGSGSGGQSNSVEEAVEQAYLSHAKAKAEAVAACKAEMLAARARQIDEAVAAVRSETAVAVRRAVAAAKADAQSTAAHETRLRILALARETEAANGEAAFHARQQQDAADQLALSGARLDTLLAQEAAERAMLADALADLDAAFAERKRTEEAVYAAAHVEELRAYQEEGERMLRAAMKEWEQGGVDREGEIDAAVRRGLEDHKAQVLAKRRMDALLPRAPPLPASASQSARVFLGQQR